MDLHPAKSLPEHVLLGHSPPLGRTQSLFSGSGAARVPRTTLPLPSGSSSKLLEQAPEPSVGAFLAHGSVKAQQGTSDLTWTNGYCTMIEASKQAFFGPVPWSE